jgi:molecular chaperone GrpE
VNERPDPNRGESLTDDELLADEDLAGSSDGAVEPNAGEEFPMGTILTDVVSLAKERDEYLNSLQRLQADFENYRKRVVRQQEEQSARAALELVRALLPILDTLDLARSHLETEGDVEMNADARALTQARSMLIDVLGKEGLERVDESGVAFDPAVHDAVAHIPGGDEEASEIEGHNVVDEVLRAGYRWRGQVVRPAMVRVKG